MKSQHIFNRHVDFALICLDKHEKGKPFHPTLHRYFKENKQFGSRDRKRIKNLCYDWFRLGYSLQGLTKREQVFLAFLIVEETIPEWLLLGFERFVLPPSWLTWGIDKRLDFIEKARTSINELHLKKMESDKLASELDILETQAKSPTPKKNFLRDALKSVRTILEGAAGNIAAKELIRVINTLKIL